MELSRRYLDNGFDGVYLACLSVMVLTTQMWELAGDGPLLNISGHDNRRDKHHVADSEARASSARLSEAKWPEL
jgi:hypothetical protein